jgi:FKBP-type peptidyl-prolyl cis-trans isomerase
MSIISKFCNKCKVEKKEIQICSACKQVSYCSKDHQKQDWPDHKRLCLEAREALESGFIKKIIKAGDGPKPQPGDTIIVHYTGSLVNGTIFDSSRERNETFEFSVGEGEVIKGWDEGLLTFNVGERSTLILSPSYGYGDAGAGSDIPPGAILIFDIELIKIWK